MESMRGRYQIVTSGLYMHTYSVMYNTFIHTYTQSQMMGTWTDTQIKTDTNNEEHEILHDTPGEL